MEMAIAGSPGWSESGGPWVPPSQGMKKYVWSETVIDGGNPYKGKIAHPPTNTGAFQNMGIRDALGTAEHSAPEYYADSVVLAYPLQAGYSEKDSEKPVITSSFSELNAPALSDGDLNKTIDVPIPAADSETWIQFAYSQPHTVCAVSYVIGDIGFAGMIAGVTNPDLAIEASDNGENFRQIAKLNGGNAPEHTISFDAVTAKYFRVIFRRTPPPPRPAWAEGLDPATFGGGRGITPPKAYQIAELVLHTEPRINRFEEKAAFSPGEVLYPYSTPAIDPKSAIKKADVIDLTSKMHPDGMLDWTPPPGKWMVLRFGYSLLGITNHPATAEATGLEVDKLDRRFVKDYFDKYLDSYKDTVGADEMGKKGIRYVINDSWEAGAQNWTDNMQVQFKKLRGYDATPWLPVLTGRIVESSDASERFLWDFRKTIGDLLATEHYGQLEATLHERGMGHYGESHESGRALVADGMEVKKLNEVPMSAMWTQRPGVNAVQYGYNADDRESASVAHIYGQNIAAAESMTAAAAPWGWYPAVLKPTADQELINGINRFVIHESAHQPLIDKAPGLSLGPFGQWFNRNETWAEQAGAWMTYLARSSYMLQQGNFGADIIYFYGEDSNLTELFRNSAPNIPAGYGFDYINADAVMHELTVSGGQITTKSGIQYRLLGLDPNSQHMSLPVLKALYKLVEDGAVVAGPKPVADPSLADSESEFEQLVVEMFGDGTGVHKLGRGTIYAGATLKDAFQALHVAPDFDSTKSANDSDVQFVHRKLSNGDIYFLDNRNNRSEAFDATFRVSGKEPELWYAETGSSRPVSFKVADGRTTIPIRLEPWGTVFVVFRKATSSTSHVIPDPKETTISTINGSWKLDFQAGRGAPASITVNQLTDWSSSDDPSVKYFSGIGTYTKTIQASSNWFKSGAKIWIDLGDVKNLATVAVNGKQLGVAWHTPYRIDATSALKPGDNEITVQVVNSWVNRMIGDQQPGATQYTFTAAKPYKANSPLTPSGLLGPVKVIREEAQ
jgi:alpha-L-rhamnosidase/Glycosyl hydrolases family 2, sugar binding domain